MRSEHSLRSTELAHADHLEYGQTDLTLRCPITFAGADGNVRATGFYLYCPPAAVARAIDGTISERVLMAQLFGDGRE